MRYESAFVVALLLFLPRIQKLNDFFFHLPRRIAAWKVFSQDVVFDSYGILLTMTDSRTNYGKQIDTLIRQAYGSKIKVFDQTILRSVRAAETSAAGKSIFQYDPKSKVAEAYQSLAKEVLVDAEKRLKRSTERSR